jgi:uncharacterized membrane protein
MESPELAGELSDQDRILLVFDYLGPLALFSLVASRRELVKWHARQGLLLTATVAALYVLVRPIYLLLRQYAWPFFADLFWATISLVGVGILLLMLMCVVRALEGERFKIPLLGDLADRF